MLLTFEFTHGPGDVVSVRVVEGRDRVVVGYRTEWPEGGARTAIAMTGRYSEVLPGGLRGRPVVYEDGTVQPCDVVGRSGRR